MLGAKSREQQHATFRRHGARGCTGSLEPAFLPAGGSCNGVGPKGSIMANATTMMEKWQENYHYVFTELRDPR